MSRVRRGDHRGIGGIVIPGGPVQSLMREISIIDQVIPIGQGAFFELGVIHPETAGGFPDPDAKIDGGGTRVRGQGKGELLTLPHLFGAGQVRTVEETGGPIAFGVLDT